MRFPIDEHASRRFRQVFNIRDSSLGHHLTLCIPIELESDNGVFHAIEHLLVTSARLIEVSKSLHISHFNAHTTPDAVSFSFSSVCGKCFLEFLQILVHAVFASNFTREDFEREVHGSGVNDRGAPAPGVIVNEMKSTLTSRDRQLALRIRALTLTGTRHAFNSGGYPDNICTLTYEDLVSTYQRYFAPSNATVLSMFGGDYEAVLAILNNFVSPAPLSPRDQSATSARIASTLADSRFRETYNSYNHDDELVVCKVWRLGSEIAHRDRILFDVLCRYVFKLAGVGLLSAIQKIDGVVGLARPIGFEKDLAIPLIVVSLKLDRHIEAMDAHISEAIQSVGRRNIDADFLRALASTMKMEINDLMPASTREPSGIKLLKQLQSHVRLGYPVTDLNRADSHVDSSVESLSDAKSFGDLLTSTFLENRQSALIEFTPSCQPSAPLRGHATPYHDSAVVIRPGIAELPRDCAQQPSGSSAAIETLDAKTACMRQEANGVFYHFLFRIVDRVEPGLVKYLPFYSKYVGEAQFLDSVVAGRNRSGGGQHLSFHDNTFFRGHPSRPAACFLYRQIFGRGVESDLANYRDRLEWKLAGVDYQRPKLVKKLLASLASERRSALAKFPLAFASIQASKFYSLESHCKVTTTGLESFEWLEREETVDELVDQALPQIASMWSRAPEKRFVVSTLGASDLRAALGDATPERQQDPQPHMDREFAPRRISEFWVTGGGSSAVVCCFPVQTTCAHELLCLKVAEILIGQSDLFANLRSRGVYNAGVNLSVSEMSFRIYSEVTNTVASDLQTIIAFCTDFVSTFNDQDALTTAAHKVAVGSFALPSIPYDGLERYLDSLFGEISPRNYPPAALEKLDVPEFRRVLSKLFLQDRCSVVVLADSLLTAVVDEHSMNVRQISPRYAS